MEDSKIKKMEREACVHYCSSAGFLKGKSDADSMRALRERHVGAVMRRQEAGRAAIDTAKAALSPAERKKLAAGGAAAATALARSLTRWHVKFPSEAGRSKALEATRVPSGDDRPSACVACGDGDWSCPFATPLETYRNTFTLLVRSAEAGFRTVPQGQVPAGVRLGRAVMMPPGPLPPAARSLADVAAGRSTRGDPYGVKKLVADELARRRAGRDPANFAATEDELLVLASQAVQALAKRGVLVDACAVGQTRANVRVVTGRLHSPVDRAALAAIAGGEKIAAAGGEMKKSDDDKRAGAAAQPEPAPPANGAAAKVIDELATLASDLWNAASVTLEWPCDPPDAASPVTCLSCMERTHSPGECELVPTDRCTVLQLVFAKRVGDAWLDACDPLAAQCKVLRWGTGVDGNSRDGLDRVVHFFWWTSDPSTIVDRVTAVVDFARRHDSDLVLQQIDTGANFIARASKCCRICASLRHSALQCPVAQLDAIGLGQDSTLAPRIHRLAHDTVPEANAPLPAAGASVVANRRVTEEEWQEWQEVTDNPKIGKHVWCLFEWQYGPGACRKECKWAHLQHSMPAESSQRSAFRCPHGRACPDTFLCRRDHGERAVAQRAADEATAKAAEAKEKAAAEREFHERERLAAEQQQKDQAHRQKMAKMQLQKLEAQKKIAMANAAAALAAQAATAAVPAAAAAVAPAPAAPPAPPELVAAAAALVAAAVPAAAAAVVGVAAAASTPAVEAAAVAAPMKEVKAPATAVATPAGAPAAAFPIGFTSTTPPSTTEAVDDTPSRTGSSTAAKRKGDDSPPHQRALKATATPSPARGKPAGVTSQWLPPPDVALSPLSDAFPALPFTLPRPPPGRGAKPRTGSPVTLAVVEPRGDSGGGGPAGAAGVGAIPALGSASGARAGAAAAPLRVPVVLHR